LYNDPSQQMRRGETEAELGMKTGFKGTFVISRAQQTFGS